MDHYITVDVIENFRLEGLFQLSPAELLGTKEYVFGLLREGRIKSYISPHEASQCFVHCQEKSTRVVHYRGINRITKKNSSTLP